MSERCYLSKTPGTLVRSPAFPDRLTKCSKQGTVYWIGLWIVLGMPLDTQRKTRCIGNSNSLDRIVLCHTLDDDAISGL